MATTTLDPIEIKKFSAMAEAWWDPKGPMRPLHLLNPCRLAFLRDQIIGHFGIQPSFDQPIFQNLSLLDIGCGGGLVSEPMSRLGANVTGIDAAEENIHVAQTHAKWAGLDIDYRATSVESLASTHSGFNIVLALEVVEHVANVNVFIQSCAQLLQPNGLLIMSTLNRTPQSFLSAIIGAEYLMRWLPRGTHDWHKFVKPSELIEAWMRQGLRVKSCQGMEYKPLTRQWRISNDPCINYFLVGTKTIENHKT